MVQVSQPRLINRYNKDMGGVDRADQNISCYRISIRSKKWWWSLFAWTIDMVVQNGWLLYRQFKKPDQPPLDLLGFHREIVNVVFSKFCSARATAGRPREQFFQLQREYVLMSATIIKIIIKNNHSHKKDVVNVEKIRENSAESVKLVCMTIVLKIGTAINSFCLTLLTYILVNNLICKLCS